MWTVSDIYVPYPGVGSHAPSAPGASCQAPVTLLALFGRLPRAGGLPGRLPFEGVQKGGQPPVVFFNITIVVGSVSGTVEGLGSYPVVPLSNPAMARGNENALL